MFLRAKYHYNIVGKIFFPQSKFLRDRRVFLDTITETTIKVFTKVVTHLKNTSYQIKLHFQVIQMWNFLSCKFKGNKA